MINNVRYWIRAKAVDISNILLVIALFYFLVFGITARVYSEYPFLFGIQEPVQIDPYKLINLLQIGVYLIVISLGFNYLYEFNEWVDRG